MTNRTSPNLLDGEGGAAEHAGRGGVALVLGEVCARVPYLSGRIHHQLRIAWRVYGGRDGIRTPASCRRRKERTERRSAVPVQVDHRACGEVGNRWAQDVLFARNWCESAREGVLVGGRRRAGLQHLPRYLCLPVLGGEVERRLEPERACLYEGRTVIRHRHLLSCIRTIRAKQSGMRRNDSTVLV